MENTVQELKHQIAVFKGKVNVLEDTRIEVAVKVNENKQYSLLQNARGTGFVGEVDENWVAKFVTLCTEKKCDDTGNRPYYHLFRGKQL